ncbi:MAG TPA: MFS transporter [Candidatus Acidoferrales bacterium]|jgi:putative MFS transporter|nr:MFS transporter [Candidatus Acidoferrales bacterium]
MGGNSPAEITARIDRLPACWTVWRLVVLLSLGAFFEMYDLFQTAYVSPGLISSGIFRVGAKGLFGLTDQATFAAATFAGLFAGTILFGSVADKFGRRTVFTWSMLWYTVANVSMGLQHTNVGVDAWRFISGLGIGVEIVTIDAYISEFAPRRIRGRAFALNQCVQFLAIPTVALASWLLIPRAPLGITGWRWVVFLGALGAIAVWFIRRGIPESPRWLAQQLRLEEAGEAIGLIEARVEREIGHALGEPVVGPAELPGAGKFSEIWEEPYGRRTFMLIVFNFFQTIAFYGFGNWVPALMASKGANITNSLQYSAIIALMYPVGPLLCTLFADSFERKWQIVAAAIGTATFGLLFARQSGTVALIGFGMMITLSNNLLSYSYHAYQAELYPTRIRARAIGFVYSWSRLSTMFTSFMIAFFLERFGTRGVFAFIAASMLMVILSVGIFGPRTNNLALEEISH